MKPFAFANKTTVTVEAGRGKVIERDAVDNERRCRGCGNSGMVVLDALTSDGYQQGAPCPHCQVGLVVEGAKAVWRGTLSMKRDTWNGGVYWNDVHREFRRPNRWVEKPGSEFAVGQDGEVAYGAPVQLPTWASPYRFDVATLVGGAA